MRICCTKKLLDDRIKEEIVAQYIQTSGELVFTKTRGPKYVARLNKACELVGL